MEDWIPPAEYIPGDDTKRCGKVNHYFVADDAFPLARHILKPFKGGNVGLSNESRNTNYRLSRGRMTVECIFGHMTRRFGILDKLTTGRESSVLIVYACCHLHNFIRLSRHDDENEWKLIEQPTETEPEQFGKSVTEADTVGFTSDDDGDDDGDDGDDDGEMTRARLHCYFNNVDNT